MSETIAKNMTPKYVIGGIGDALQSLESAIKEKEINLFSHFKNAPDIFTKFDINIQRFEYFSSMKEMNSIFLSGTQLERKFYPQIPKLEAPIKKPAEKIITGIHIEGSAFSNDVWTAAGCPSKNMNEDFLLSLIKSLNLNFPKIFLYVFCSPERKEEMSALFTKHAKQKFNIIAFDNIWDSLTCVLHCDNIIGMDSCIKTMANIHRIFTVTLVGDYPDTFRNQNFIDPYVHDGHMKVIKFKNINEVDPEEIIFHLLNE